MFTGLDQLSRSYVLSLDKIVADTKANEQNFKIIVSGSKCTHWTDLHPSL